MRLLNTKTLVFREFQGSKVPKYVIISHRWSDEEVSMLDFLEGRREGYGWTKIVKACEIASSHGRGSSAELSEAINSMYTFYRDSLECYVFLPDVRAIPTSSSGRNIDIINVVRDEVYQSFYLSDFRSSEWFTRGWTLQELLAPRIVTFFNTAFEPIGSKSSLSTHISSITGISDRYLGGNERTIHSANVAERMKWASERETTRTEDMAYSLLGIFDVNMPLMYGEGWKAFMRLQAEIIKKSADESIFAWRAPDSRIKQHIERTTSMGRSSSRLMTGRPKVGHGLLARTPRAFSTDSQIEYVIFEFRRHYEMTNRGLRFNIRISASKDISNEEIVTALLPLNCVEVVKDDSSQSKAHRVAIKADLRVDSSARILEGRRIPTETRTRSSIALADVSSGGTLLSGEGGMDKFSEQHNDYDFVLEAAGNAAEDWDVYFPQDGM